MDALEGRAELFAAISDPNHEYWIERPERRPAINELNLFRVHQMTPLLFAAWEQLPDQFGAVLRIVNVVSFRYSTVSALKPSDLEAIYHEAARAVLDGEARTPSQVFARLRHIYVPDDRFRQNFAAMELDTGGQRKRLVKYVLARLESDRAGRLCDPDTDPATIEHVLPENPGSEWDEAFPPERREQWTYRLGNLTLLEPSRNRALGRADYATKAAYADSSYALTRRLAELAPAEWTPALIDARQRELADRATHLWRLDF
jgi:hypothetical protein